MIIIFKSFRQKCEVLFSTDFLSLHTVYCTLELGGNQHRGLACVKLDLDLHLFLVFQDQTLRVSLDVIESCTLKSLFKNKGRL